MDKCLQEACLTFHKTEDEKFIVKYPPMQLKYCSRIIGFTGTLSESTMK